MASTACIPSVPASGDAGLRERARGALLGLAVGDALGAPAENMKPSEIRARWGRITGYVAERPSGTDDTEYAILSGLLLARHGRGLTPAHVEAAWHEWIADREEGPFRGAGFSERGTLENLRRGLAAPVSAQHRHAWSDGLAMRAAPHGVFAAGRPAEAARLAAIDGSVSHDGEGIYGGQAVAAGVAAAMTGAPPVAVVASALAVVPEDSWTARCLRRAMTAAHLGERAVRSAVVIGGYPWTDLAPEAVALAFGAYAAADGDFTDAVLAAVNMGRDADTTAAVAGALAGATHGIAAIPRDWAAAIGPARGSCLPAMAGHHVLEVADLLVGGGAAPDGRGGARRTVQPRTVPDAAARTPAGVTRTTPETAAPAEPDGRGRGPAQAGTAPEVPGGPAPSGTATAGPDGRDGAVPASTASTATAVPDEHGSPAPHRAATAVPGSADGAVPAGRDGVVPVLVATVPDGQAHVAVSDEPHGAAQDSRPPQDEPEPHGPDHTASDTPASDRTTPDEPHRAVPDSRPTATRDEPEPPAPDHTPTDTPAPDRTTPDEPHRAVPDSRPTAARDEPEPPAPDHTPTDTPEPDRTTPDEPRGATAVVAS